MKLHTARLGWALALLFAAAAAILNWKYTMARRDAHVARRNYEILQQRVEDQARSNDELDASLRALSLQLSDAQTRIELLGKSIPQQP